MTQSRTNKPGMLTALTVLSALIVLIALTITGCGTANTGQPDRASSDRLRVAAAADLQFALPSLTAEFSALHPQWQLDITIGSSGTFVQQLANGAPFDIFLSADRGYADRVVALGAASPAALFGYASGSLVLVANTSSQPPVRDLAGLTTTTGRIAIANPAHAPYGQAAVTAMQAAGVYEQLQDRLVLGENAAQAAEFVNSGAASFGVLATPLVRNSPLDQSHIVTDIPQHYYLPLDQTGLITNRATAKPAALAFRDYLLSEAGQQVLAAYGFGPPNPEWQSQQSPQPSQLGGREN